jgi:hypothetical protein
VVLRFFPCTPMAQEGPMAQYSAPESCPVWLFFFSRASLSSSPVDRLLLSLLPPKSQPNLVGGRDRGRGGAPALGAWAARGGAAVGSAPRSPVQSALSMARGLWLLSRAVGRLRPLLVQGPRRGFSASAPEQLHVCVVGSGPAGFYTADRVGGFTTRPFLSC